jgi:hypothetical protein
MKSTGCDKLIYQIEIVKQRVINCFNYFKILLEAISFSAYICIRSNKKGVVF